MCMLVSVLYGFALGLCEGACVYVHDTLCMTMLIVTTMHKLRCQVVTTHSQDNVFVPSDGVGVKVNCWVVAHTF